MTADGDEFSVPPQFHTAIVDYARHIAYGYDEDNSELEAFCFDKYQRAVADLSALRLKRAGRSNPQFRVQGYHF